MTGQGLRVVFTGPAYGPAGEQILRADLMAAAAAAGMVPLGSWSSDCQLLVSSRTDTVKAAKAANRGIPVLTYPAFLEQYQLAVQPGNPAQRCPFTDTHEGKAPHPGLIGGDEL